MNILFYTYGKVSSTKGGTERTTTTLARELSQVYGCRCFSLYESQDTTVKEACFVEEYHWKQDLAQDTRINFVRDIVIRHDIRVIIDQGAFIHVSTFKTAIKGLNCKIILAHHFYPGAEVLFYNLGKWVREFHTAKSLRARCLGLKRILLFPIERNRAIASLRHSYHQAYALADRVVLLHEAFISKYENFGGFHNQSKFVIIPNALSYDTFLTEQELEEKRQQVLIVARLDETHKRLSLALDIWNKVMKSGIADWELLIAGDGPSRTQYQDKVRKECIPNVHFLGRRDPEELYRQSSIFLMTSRSESWGLTLTEAQQFGVVPMAFNTYDSLSEIINNGVDGEIIEEGNVDLYSDKLVQLIQDREKREWMGLQAIKSSQRFSQSRIAEKWWNLLNGMVE